MVAAHLADTGGLEQLASLYLGVTVLDQVQEGTVAALADERAAALAVAASRARGYLDGRSLAEVFAWLRPNDLIWNYWVNNYLQGKRPRRRSTSCTGTPTPPGCLPRCTATSSTSPLTSALAKPGARDDARLTGGPVPGGRGLLPAWLAIADHLCPWQSCYRSTQLLGGDVRFVLSTSGHIASMINPPDNPKARVPGGAAPGRRSRPTRPTRGTGCRRPRP